LRNSVVINHAPHKTHGEIRQIHVDYYRQQPVAYPGILFGGGSTNSVEDRQNGDLQAEAP